MNKEELKDLFEEPLAELDEFTREIQKIKKLINLIIENFDLLKDDITDDQIGEVSSEINVKMSKIISLIKDVMSDSKLLESFIHEIKLLKRKRNKKLGKKDDITKEDLAELIEKLKRNFPYTQPYTQPYIPQTQPKKHPYLPPDWKINF
jgi:methyl-accepting chemotaxis protein